MRDYQILFINMFKQKQGFIYVLHFPDVMSLLKQNQTRMYLHTMYHHSMDLSKACFSIPLLYVNNE
jgi:hypothetical protein